MHQKLIIRNLDHLSLTTKPKYFCMLCRQFGLVSKIRMKTIAEMNIFASAGTQHKLFWCLSLSTRRSCSKSFIPNGIFAPNDNSSSEVGLVVVKVDTCNETKWNILATWNGARVRCKWYRSKKIKNMAWILLYKTIWKKLEVFLEKWELFQNLKFYCHETNRSKISNSKVNLQIDQEPAVLPSWAIESIFYVSKLYVDAQQVLLVWIATLHKKLGLINGQVKSKNCFSPLIITWNCALLFLRLRGVPTLNILFISQLNLKLNIFRALLKFSCDVARSCCDHQEFSNWFVNCIFTCVRFVYLEQKNWNLINIDLHGNEHCTD